MDRICSDKKYNFKHKCSTRGGTSGSPILGSNNKVLCIHKEGFNDKCNKGLFLSYPIKEFIKIYSNNNQLNNEYNPHKLELNIINIPKNEQILNDDLKNINFDNPKMILNKQLISEDRNKE